jgi:hypothetical protein
MSNTNNSTELTLQVYFGMFGVFGTVIALAGLHHRDSLGCVLIRNIRRCRTTSASSLPERMSCPDVSRASDHFNIHNDSEAGPDTCADDDVPASNALGDRRPTLPPAYDQSGGTSSNTFGLPTCRVDADIRPLTTVKPTTSDGMGRLQ